MVHWVAWARKNLQSSGEGLEWAFSRFDGHLQFALPFKGYPINVWWTGWSPARYVWDASQRDRFITLREMHVWLGGDRLDILWELNGESVRDLWWDDYSIIAPPKLHTGTEMWIEMQNEFTAEQLIERFWNSRKQMIELVDDLSDVDWNQPQDTGYGEVRSLSRVVMESYQRTLDHSSKLLALLMGWGRFGTRGWA